MLSQHFELMYKRPTSRGINSDAALSSRPLGVRPGQRRNRHCSGVLAQRQGHAWSTPRSDGWDTGIWGV